MQLLLCLTTLLALIVTPLHAADLSIEGMATPGQSFRSDHRRHAERIARRGSQ